ncbi:MAG TPA: TolC family protein [Terracidiphilus sp.]|nr:TolC family protein [Terracidiphilus sp.]
MAVDRVHQLVLRRLSVAFFFAILALAGVAVVRAQAGNPSSASNPFLGSVTVQPTIGELLNLSLDDAIQRGLENNLGLREAESGQKILQGEKNEALQEFLPTITLTGDTGVYQHNLAALGFSPRVAAKFSSLMPPGVSGKFTPITRDDLTQGQIHFEQTLFSGPVIAAWKAAGAAERVAYYARMSAEGEVIQQVAVAYLRAIAAASEVDNARALVSEDQLALDHAREAHEAGTVANLDVLRAQVELQSQQQVVIAAENDLDKDLILLKREIGISPGQKIELTDRAPYSELATETPDEVRAVAYKSRQDYQNLQNQVIEYKAVRTAYRSQRLPSLSFKGYYGVSTVNGAGTHGNFAVFGTLSFPIFREARLRGDVDAAQAELNAANAQLDDLRARIDEQVRDALMDVATTAKLVDVARSNVDLARQALSDETDRVNAGVDNNLPLVTAQATLASAQNNLVESLYRYNVAKLGLARAAGVLQTQYRAYLGR